ncbi:MAG: transporter [Deltaproteobacteria bacterium]|nr:transporter [Deltaproteobacteria bacterium]MBU48899.1 transporter [Deltaproteobacteria bacterium]|tara:strand:+ start:1183 stop:1824 length:642 start_codon:yes stop_codon:yes gene_type:complete
MMGQIADFYIKGGMFMHPIALCSVVGLGLIIERFIFLFFKYNINGKAFMAQIQKLVMANNIDRAIKLCNAAPAAALPKVIKAGLARANKGPTAIANALEETQLEVLPKVQKRTNQLSAVANVATMLGLLGTIFGLIQAFAALDKASADEKAKKLAEYISVALNTTAFGLVVAIPCLSAHAVLSYLTKKIVDEVEEYALKLEHMLTNRMRSQQR